MQVVYFEQSAANGIISDDIIKKNQEKDLTSEDEKYGEETGNEEMLEGEDQEDFSSENGNFKEEVGNEEVSEDENQEGSLSEDRNTEEEPFKEGDQESFPSEDGNSKKETGNGEILERDEQIDSSSENRNPEEDLNIENNQNNGDSTEQTEGVPDIVVEIEENELERARVEPISIFDIVKLEGVDINGKQKIENISNSGIDRTVFRAKNRYKRDKLIIDIRRRGSNGSVREYSLDCETNNYGKPYNIIYDAYGGLLEYTYRNIITITNPDTSELHIQYVVKTTWNNGDSRQIIRDIFIPLVEERVGAPQTPEITYKDDYPDSYVLTGIDSSMEYAVVGDPYVRGVLKWESCTNEDMPFTPTAKSQFCFVRYKAEDSNSESQYKELIIPARKSMPPVYYNNRTEILSNLTTEMEYSIGGSEYTAVTEEMVSEKLSKIVDSIESDSIDFKVRYKINNAPVSFEKVITLYKRLEPPADVSLNLITFRLEGTKNGMEYRTDDMKEDTWISISSSTVDLSKKVSGEKSVGVQIRYKATSTNAPSKSVAFTLPQLISAPLGLSVDYQKETITGFDTANSYEYSTSATGSYSAISLSANGEFNIKTIISSYPKTLYIRVKANQEHPFSASVQLDIPGRKKSPSSVKFVYNDERTTENQAILINVSPAMEYKPSSSSEWIPISDSSLIFDILEKSITYSVREKATATDFASNGFSVSLKTYYSKAGCSINTSTEEIKSLNNIMEYRKNGGEFTKVGDEKALPLSEIADALSGNETYVLEFRYMRREDYPVGQIKTFVIHPRPEAPSNLSYDATTFTLSGVSAQMQYREVGSTSWRSISGSSLNLKSSVNGRPNVQVEVCYKPKNISVDNYAFASKATVVNLY